MGTVILHCSGVCDAPSAQSSMISFFPYLVWIGLNISDLARTYISHRSSTQTWLDRIHGLPFHHPSPANCAADHHNTHSSSSVHDGHLPDVWSLPGLCNWPV